ncbi:MAG: hypothetical protein RLZZ179_27 [Verrucomicrobiota bacterium]
MHRKPKIDLLPSRPSQRANEHPDSTQTNNSPGTIIIHLHSPQAPTASIILHHKRPRRISENGLAGFNIPDDNSPCANKSTLSDHNARQQSRVRSDHDFVFHYHTPCYLAGSTDCRKSPDAAVMAATAATINCRKVANFNVASEDGAWT